MNGKLLWPLIAAALFILPVLLSFLRFRIRFTLRFFYDGGFRMHMLFRLRPARLRLFYKPVLLKKRGLVLAAERKDGLHIPKKKSRYQKQKRKRIFLALLPCVRFRSLELRGRIGIADDAACCCFMAGAVGVFLHALLRAASIAFLGGSAGFAPQPCGIRPDLSHNSLDIRLCGIVEAVPAKLTKSLLTALISESKYKNNAKKEKNYASDREHYADLHGADQAYG